MIEVTATTLQNRVVALGAPLSLEIHGSMDSPAVSCRIAVHTGENKITTHYKSLAVTHNGAVLFTGATDQVSYTSSDKGKVLALEARSAGALLLDNEALPGTLWNATLSTIFSRYLAPHGFVLQAAQLGRNLPVFNIAKGMSLWEVFQRFAKRLYGKNPYVWQKQVLCQAPAWQGELLLSNQRGTAYTLLEQIYRPYAIYSEIVVRDPDGYYSTRVANPEAKEHGVSRSRYHIPTTEYTNHPSLDAFQKIKDSMYQSQQWRCVLPGIVPVHPAMGVEIADASFAKRGLLLHQWEYRIGTGGTTTTVWLTDSIYHE